MVAVDVDGLDDEVAICDWSDIAGVEEDKETVSDELCFIACWGFSLSLSLYLYLKIWLTALKPAEKDVAGEEATCTNYEEDYKHDGDNLGFKHFHN